MIGFRALTLCIGIVVAAQVGVAVAADKNLAFDVISIRQHTAASGPVQRPTITPNGFSSIGLSLFAIFQTAYVPTNQSGVLRGDLIAGAPRWLSDEKYDIIAKVRDADLADWQKSEMNQTMLHAMLQAMLAERCKVLVHHESRELPVYELMVAKGGPKFKPAETVDPEELRQKPGGGGMMTGTGVRAIPTASGIRYFGISMAILSQTILPGMAGRPVLDKTGLTGYYDLTLSDPNGPSVAPAAPAPTGPSQRQNAPPQSPPPSTTDESIFTVLPDALGLRLQAAKGQVEMLVIDHVEPPSGN